MSTTLERTIFGATEHDLVGVVQEESPTEATLGDLFWFTLPALKITPATLADAYRQAGISEKLLPPPIEAHDAFRRATSRLALESSPVSLLIRPGGHDKERIIRYVTAEIQHEIQHEKKLRYSAAATFIFNRRDNTASAHITDFLPPEAQVLVDAAVEKFPGEFADCQRYLESEHVRMSIYKIMDTEHIIRARPSGGVYFALQAHNTAMRQIETLLGTLKPLAPNADFYSLTVRDAAKDLAMVTNATTNHVRVEANSLLRDMGNLLDRAAAGHKIRQQTAEGFLEEAKRLTQLLEEYRNKTRDQFSDAASDLDLVRRQVIALMNVAE